MGEIHEKTDAQLLRDYAEHADEQAFHELVTRYTDLVYSAAVRQVSSPDLARDVAQSVFTDLARKSGEVAAKAASEASLAGWLFRSTRFAALNQLRTERQRLAHERQIMDQLDLTPESDHDWDRIRPVLDEAIADLNDADRDALLLRFFKNRDFRAIGETLGLSDDAAQKRVSRALDKLRAEFARRGVTTTVTALGGALSVNAVTAAPIGLASTFSAAALAGAATVSTTVTTATIVNTIAMTTLQKAVIATVLAAAVGAGLYQTKKVSDLRKEVQVLQEQQEPLSRQVAALEKERGEASNVVAALTEQNDALRKRPTEVLQLRGENARLQTEKAAMGRTAALSKMTETPEARKFMRDQQKGAMAMIYTPFAKDASLGDEKKEALHDLLADNIMENVDLITTALRDKPGAADTERLFALSEADLKSKVESLLGAEAYPRYQEFTRDLAATLTADQFSGKLTGESPEKDAKKKQLLNLVREEMRSVLASAGLPADFQVVPILNFRNIFSEAEAERNLKVLDQIYAGVVARGSAFLSPEELKKFEEFRRAAIEQSRIGLTMNRTLMAPLGQ